MRNRSLTAAWLLLLLSGCHKFSTSKLAAVAQDTETAIIKVPTPADLIDFVGPFMPVLKSRDYQRVQRLPVGYRILCSNSAERNAFLQGLGVDPVIYANAAPVYDDVEAPPADIQALHLDEQPILRCPADQGRAQEKPRLVLTQSNPPLYYLNFVNSPVANRDNAFYEVGCEGIISGLGLNKGNAVPINFQLDRPNATKIDINCPNGEAPAFNPFLAECEAAVRATEPNADQEAYQIFKAQLPGFQGQTCTDLWNFVKGMTDLVLPSEVLESIKPVEYMTNLRNIDVHDNFLSSLAPLEKLVKLRTLDISDNPNLIDIQSLSALKALTTIKAKKTKVRDLTALTLLPKLEVLEFETRHIEPSKCPIGPEVASDALKNFCQPINTSDFVRACEADATTGGSTRTIYLPLKIQFNKQTCFDLYEAIKTIPAISVVNQPALADISGLQYLTQLQELDLHGNRIESIETIGSKLVNLRKLDLSGNLIQDISSLQSLNLLTRLNLGQNRIVDARPLQALTVFSSAELNLLGNPLQLLPQFKDWCRLTISADASATVARIKTRVGFDLCTATPEALATVTELTLDNLGLKTLGPVGTLPLVKLSARSNEIDSVAFVETLPALTKVDLTANKIASVPAMVHLTALRKLNLSGNAIVSVAALRRLDQLEELDLSYNRIVITRDDVEGGFPSLRWLDLSSNPIADVSSLSYFPIVEQLYVRNATITDPQGLQLLPLVKHLDISQNNLSNASILGEIVNLESLIAERCTLTDITALSLLTKLSIIDLSGNQLRNVSVLAQNAEFRNRLRFLDLRDNSLNGECPVAKPICYK